MKNLNSNYIENVKHLYTSTKKILEILSNADHPLSPKLRNTITLKQVEDMHQFVQGLEDHGVQLLFKKRAN